ncbi:hypothetical protein [Catenulispora rubra]|uniref:hypothetical protein n=1 Tax=Catenulispora rubra TaxID=280293 RepID=UPI001892596B|nr:hypothetical protein [Catenulispora rubra]
MTNLFSSTRSSTRSSRRRSAAIAAAGAVTVLGTLPFAQAAHAASGFQRAAYFVGADGSLDVFGSNSDGVWSKAAPVTPAKSAPAGAPVTAVRGPSGRLLAYYVGGDGAVYESCGAVGGSFAAVTGSGFAPAGSPVSATLTGREVHLTVGSSGGFSSASDDDPPMCGTGVHWWGPGPRPKWWTVGGDFATVGYTDGEVGVFQAGNDGAVHALWGTAAGQWQEATLTGTGIAAPGAGLGATVSSAAGAGIRTAAASPNATAPTPGATSIFYAGRDGRVNVEHPATGGLSDKPVALPGDPEPSPWKAHVGALSAADGTTQIAYISSTGTLFVAGTVNGQWQPPKQVSSAGFGIAGSSVGVAGLGGDDIDVIYCGTPPGHIHIGPGGPVYTNPALGSVVAGTVTAAAQ